MPCEAPGWRHPAPRGGAVASFKPAKRQVVCAASRGERLSTSETEAFIPAVAIMVIMLALNVAGVADLMATELVAAILMVAIGVLSEQEARDTINWEVYVTIASAFAIGTALVKSRVAASIANLLVRLGATLGIDDTGIIGSVYFATFMVSNVVTNNAAAALIFPIAMDAPEQTGVDIVQMAFAVMLSASASFMSPFGYATNLLIYGPGGYKFMDFVKFGGPMQIVLWVFTTAMLSISMPWYLSWIAAGVILLLVVALQFCKSASFPVGCCRKRQPEPDS